MKGVSKWESKTIKFEDFYKCLFGCKYEKEDDIHSIKTNNLERYLQKLCKSILSLFFMKNDVNKKEIEGFFWN